MATHLNNDECWFAVAGIIAMRSRCSRSQTGAVIVSSETRIVATGFNGPPASFVSEGPCINWCERAKNDGADAASGYMTCPAVHAEANALLYASRDEVRNGTIYVTRVPCMDCAKQIANSGLRRVMCYVGDPADAIRPWQAAIDFMDMCGLEVIQYEPITRSETSLRLVRK